MNTMCWNCRGMGNPWSVRQRRRWSVSYAPDIIFLSETMSKKNAAESLKERLGYQNAFAIACIGRAGGLFIFWTEDVKFNLVSFSQNHICCDIDAGSMS